MKIGYARVSTDDQRLDLQIAALRNAGCVKIYKDHGASGAIMERPGLTRMLQKLEPGQTLVVWRLDRLGRSLTGLVQMIDELGKRGVDFQSLTEEINTTTSGGRLIFHIMAALAEFERSLISERTKAGMLAARQCGKHLGRPHSLSRAQINKIMSDSKKYTIPELAEKYGVSTRTLKRRIEEHEQSRLLPTRLAV